MPANRRAGWLPEGQVENVRFPPINAIANHRHFVTSRPMRTRLSICNRKARYTSGREANLAMANATIVLRAYHCDRCRQFHLTSRTKGKRVPRPPLRSPG